MNNNNKKQRHEPEPASSQEIFDTLSRFCELNGDNFVDSEFFRPLKVLSEQQAALGDSLAMRNLGLILLKEENYPYAEAILLKSCELGNPSGMFTLGTLYALNKYKDSGKHNIELAKFWYMNSIINGNHHKAMNNLGALYSREQDYYNAEHWYRKSAELGNQKAMKNLVELYNELANEWNEKLKKISKPTPQEVSEDFGID
jgi:TPR repeat protein